MTALRDKNFIGYPNKATRELLMNICQHRAYNGSNSPAHVYEYADRLEFDNTGNLYGKARPENFPTETDYRNPLISSVMRALGYVNRFGMGIGLVADELKANGNPPAEYVFSEPSSFKVIVRSADPFKNQVGTNPDPSKADLKQIGTNPGTNPDKSLEQKLIEIVSANRTISKTSLAHELGIGRTSLYRLLDTLQHKVKSTGGTRHTEWTVIEE